MDLNSCDENKAKNGNKKNSFLNWIFRGNYHVLSTFLVDLRSEKEILTSKFLIDIFFQYGRDRFNTKTEA